MIKSLKIISNEAKGFNKNLIFVGFFSIILFAVNIYISYLGRQLIDQIAIFVGNQFIIKAIYILSLYLVYCAFSYIVNYVQAKITLKIKISMQKKLFNSFQTSNYLANLSKSSSEVYFKMFNDVGIVVDYYLSIILTLPLNLIICIVTASFMFTYSYKLALILIIVSFAQAALIFFFRRPLKNYARLRLYSEQNLVKEVNDDFANNELARAYNLENFFSDKLSVQFSNYERAALKQTSFTILSSNISFFVGQIINMIVIFFGLFFVSLDELSLGTLFMVFTMTNYFSKGIVSLIGIFPNYLMSKLSFDRYTNVINSKDENRHYGNQPFVFNDSINVRNICYAYKDQFVLENFSCELFYGKINVIIGPNGSGKSTILKLINKFIYPSSGNIEIDGIDINDIDYVSLKENVAFMPSEDYFISGTILDNISLGNEYSQDKVNEIVTICGLDTFLNRLPGGLGTEIYSIKGTFSDGEKRKLSLARTLIRNKSVICLDEPTNHLDANAIQDVINILLSFKSKYSCTFLISTHDEQIVAISDNKIGINYGKSK